MNEQEIITKLGIIAVLVFLVGFILVIDKVEKKKEKLEKKEREEKMGQRRLENSKRESLEWNKKIQANTENQKLLYKPSRNIKALVGNYSDSISIFTNRVLKSMGIETEFVSSGHNIIDKINNNEKYDIIITNKVYTHGESGEQVLYTLKEKVGFDTPIIVLTVDQDARDEFVKHIGFDEYIAKPIKPEVAIPIFQKVIKNVHFEKVKKQ